MGDWSEWRFLKWRNTDGSQTMCIQACACMIWLCSCGCVHSQEHVYMSVFVHFRAEVDLHFSFNIENFIYPPRSREHRRKGGQKTLIHSCKMGKSAVETVWLLHAWTHCCCGYLHHILLNLKPIQLNPATWPVNSRGLFFPQHWNYNHVPAVPGVHINVGALDSSLYASMASILQT